YLYQSGILSRGTGALSPDGASADAPAIGLSSGVGAAVGFAGAAGLGAWAGGAAATGVVSDCSPGVASSCPCGEALPGLSGSGLADAEDVGRGLPCVFASWGLGSWFFGSSVLARSGLGGGALPPALIT